MRRYRTAVRALFPEWLTDKFLKRKENKITTTKSLILAQDER